MCMMYAHRCSDDFAFVQRQSQFLVLGAGWWVLAIHDVFAMIGGPSLRAHAARCPPIVRKQMACGCTT